MRNDFWWIADMNGLIPTGVDISKEKDEDDNPVIHIGLTDNVCICGNCNDFFYGSEYILHAVAPKSLYNCANCGKSYILPNKVIDADIIAWAQKPNQIITTCHKYTNREIIVDQNDITYTGDKFIQLIKDKQYFYFLDQKF